MRVGILTGGGDVPGLNPCIKAVVNRASDSSHEVLGIRRGWAGLLETNPDESVTTNVLPLDPGVVRTVDRSGGTFLHSSRANPGKVAPAAVPSFLAGEAQGDGPHDFTAHVVAVIERLELDALIPIGGDDTLSYGLRLHNEGVPVVAIPKTMDNDVPGTDYCLGFSTAVTRCVEFIHALRTSTGSHERIAVVELFGRNSGQTSLVTAYLAGTDRAIISEVPFDVERLADQLVADKRANPSNYSMVTISEGASMVGGDMVESGEADPYGHRKLGGIGARTGEAIARITGEGILSQQVGYLMRSGSPDSLDLMVSNNYGIMAADLVLAGASGRMTALRDGSYTDVSIEETGQGEKRVDVDEFYDVDAYRPRIRNVADKPMFLY